MTRWSGVVRCTSGLRQNGAPDVAIGLRGVSACLCVFGKG